MGNVFIAEKKGIEHLNVQCQGRIDQRTKGQARVAHVDEDARSSHFEDAKRGEVLINRRIPKW